MKALYGALAGRGADAGARAKTSDPVVKKVKAGRSDRVALRGSLVGRDVHHGTPMRGPLQKRSRYGTWQTREFWLHGHYLMYAKVGAADGAPDAAIDLREVC